MIAETWRDSTAEGQHCHGAALLQRSKAHGKGNMQMQHHSADRLLSATGLLEWQMLWDPSSPGPTWSPSRSAASGVMPFTCLTTSI